MTMNTLITFMTIQILFSEQYDRAKLQKIFHNCNGEYALEQPQKNKLLDNYS